MHILFAILLIGVCPHGNAAPVKEWQRPVMCDELLQRDSLARLIADYRANANEVFDLVALQRSGQDALKSANVPTISRLPSELPVLVMYSGLKCSWCDIIAPTFAEQSKNFGELKAYYSKDANLRRTEKIFSVPQLVLYSTDLKVQALGFGKSTEDFAHLLAIMTELSRSSLTGHFAILTDGRSKKLYKVNDAEQADQIVSGKAPTDED